ncbi:hypothetical protein FJV41_04800 [Myxococcus llanfairpwllgwyngyllgogerychwyrndrobwllllantysiliogogogochensis]|uniref:Uncharacterized protein n=1 Tax=Myxococcus llanfairpwllgwyngyllgogerychwyrndrobwllllantysiliogogogochensis TaxID=2590453 RepID=A0A540X8V8_9BACT|nr:hypothetical protein FJV41_04800 [Myxococcus llanfairpwllgwyngyllgogerychwyrndrobwllllantysiliogogogochensis]
MRRPNPDEWKQLVEEFEASGLTQKQFATRHEVSLSAFQYKLYKKPRSALGRRPESTKRPRRHDPRPEAKQPPHVAAVSPVLPLSVARVARATGKAISRVRKGRDEAHGGARPEGVVEVWRIAGKRPWIDRRRLA